jgi:uncharacterized protein (TIGR00369 family)
LLLEPNPTIGCFVCGGANVTGMRLSFERDDAARRVRASFRVGSQYQGAKGFVHGGIIATLLDEIMAKVSLFHGVQAVTAELAVEYLRPVPVDQDLIAEGHEVKREGRNLHYAGEIRNTSGTVLARSRGRFVEVDLARFRANATPAEETQR